MWSGCGLVVAWLWSGYGLAVVWLWSGCGVWCGATKRKEIFINRSLFKASRCFVAGLRCGLARGFRQPALLQPTATPQRPPWAQALVGFRTNGFSMLTGRAANLPVAVCISPAAQCLKMSMIIVLPCCLIGSRTRRELAALGRRGLEGDLPSWMRRSTRSRRRDTSLQQEACTRR